ncbi:MULTISPECIES: helix-turn-helix domain-containing protein [unclassified Lysinibacillus]|uniref:helix-turn-helix domain-containing protein n=1 Tax=unclassified Lysinibacillus TaxID=2636778 RepID=UPI00382F3822
MKKRDYNFGPLIKITRRRFGYTQEEICDGICTPSYLSRIENCHVIPSEETYKLILERLNLDYDKFIEDLNNLDDNLETIYSKLLSKKEDIKDYDLRIFENSYLYLGNNDLYIKSRLINCKYLLSLQKYLEAEDIINQLSVIYNSFSNRNKFIYLNVAISLYYLTNQTNKALNLIINNKNNFNIQGSDFEVACFRFNVALILCKEYRHLESIDYCQNALEYFKTVYLPNFSFKCHILLAIAKNNLAQYNLARTHFNICFNILENSEKMNHPENYNMVYSNLGCCFEREGNLEKAIYNYKLALSYKKEGGDYINIIRCTYKKGDLGEAIEYLNHVNNIHEELPLKLQYQRDIFSFILLGQLNSKVANSFSDLEETCLKYFKKNKLYNLLIFYTKLFADFYKNIKLYKKSCELYEFALETSENIRKGTN